LLVCILSLHAHGELMTDAPLEDDVLDGGDDSEAGDDGDAQR